jgi:glycosyltransferase involved in cell wall biosynthesis
MDSAMRTISDYTASMRLVIDVREACRTPLTGKGRWAAGFVTALHARGVALTLLSDRALPADLLKKLQGVDIHVMNERGIFWHLKAAKLFMSDVSLDVYVSPVSYLVPCLLRGRKPCVTIVHDLIAFRSEPHDKRATFIEHITLQIAVRHSSLVCTVSETTAHDLVEKMPMIAQKTVAIYAGCDRPIAAHPSKGNGPIVCVGTLCPRKNQLRLIRAFARLPDDLRAKHPLVLIGSRGWSDNAIIGLVNETEHASWVGSITDAERNRLLHDAVLCAFPSLYEGFGLPVLEAFCAGIPVVTSHEGSLAEVAGDAACIVDPLDEQSIAGGMQKLLEDPVLRHSYAEKGLKRAEQYSWAKTADLFLQVVKKIDR